MKTFEVDVEGRTYQVDAPDPATAWEWANKHHRAAQVKLEEAGKAKGGEFTVGGKEGFKKAAEQVAGETSIGGRMLQGVGDFMERAALGTKGALTDLTPQDKQTLEQSRVMADAGGVPAMLGQAGGEMLATVPAAMATGGVAALPAAGRVATMFPQAMRLARSVPGRVAGVAAPNAAFGALTNPEDRQKGAAYGAAGGVAGAGLTRAVGGLVAPFVSRGGRELMEQGVQPTPGQAIGGWVGKTEEKLGSVPFVGDIIGHARNRAQGEFNEALAGRVSQEMTGAGGLPRAAGRALGETGDDALLQLRANIGGVYEDVLAQIPMLRIEPALVARELTRIVNDPALALSRKSRQDLIDYVNETIIQRGADITGDVAKRMESDLGKAAARYRTSGSAEERAYGEALDRLHEFWREGVTAAVPANLRPALQRANAAWRGLRPLDDAAATATSQQRGGQFTPRVLRSALAKGDKSQADNALRELQLQPVAGARSAYDYAASMTRAGRDLGDVVPDSGTTGRALTGGFAGAAGFADPLMTGAVGGGVLAATALAYSRMGAQLLTQGAFPASREAVAAWLATKGVPRDAIPALVAQTLATYGRSRAQPQQQQPMQMTR